MALHCVSLLRSRGTRPPKTKRNTLKLELAMSKQVSKRKSFHLQRSLMASKEFLHQMVFRRVSGAWRPLVLLQISPYPWEYDLEQMDLLSWPDARILCPGVILHLPV